MSHNLNRVVLLSLLITGCGGGSGSSNEANVSSPSLTVVDEQLYELNKPISSVMFSNIGGGDLTACGINPAVGGISVEVADNKKDCVLSGTPIQSQVGVEHSVTATNQSGSDSVPIKINIIPQPELNLALKPSKRFDFSWISITDINHYRLYENSDGLSGFALVDKLSANETTYSHQVALYERLNAQYTLEVCISSDESLCISSETVNVTGNLSNGISPVTASNSEDDDRLGNAIAFNLDGTVMALGSRGDDSATTGINSDGNDNDAEDSGAVYIFESDGELWRQTAYIKAHNSGAGDDFGRHVELSHDGNTLAVAASSEDSSSTGINGDATNNDSPNSGAVYVFTRDNQVWSQQAYIKASNTDARDHFGHVISLSGEGDMLAVSAYWEDSASAGIDGDQVSNELSASGAAYVFKRQDNVWSQQTYMKASNPDVSDNFGDDLVFSADGKTLVVSARKEESSNGDETNNDSFDVGAVYVFVVDNDVWQQQAYIKPSVTHEDMEFGWRLAISSNGNDLAVASQLHPSSVTGIDGDETDASAVKAGAVFVFTRAGDSWNQQAFIKAHNTSAGDYFGAAITMSEDGSLLVIGARGEDSSIAGISNIGDDNEIEDAGAVYVFKRDGGIWRQVAFLKSPTPTENGLLGGTVGMSGDGQVLGVQSVGENNGNGFYLY